MLKDNERFSQIAKEAILKYQESSASARSSLQVVADKTGTSYSTIRNILQNETPISYKMAKNILLRLSPNLTVRKLTEILGGSEASEFSHFYSNILDSSLVDDKYEAYFKNENYFEILVRAFSNKGTSLQEIQYLFGILGVERSKKLIQAGLIIEKEGRLFGNSDSDIHISLESTKKMSEFALKRYQVEDPHDAWLTFRSEGYSKENYDKIKEILREAHKKIKSLESDPNGEYQAVIVQLLIDLDKDLKRDKKAPEEMIQ